MLKLTLLPQKDRFSSKIGRKALKNVQIYFPKISQRQQKRVKPEDFTLILVPLAGLAPLAARPARQLSIVAFAVE